MFNAATRGQFLLSLPILSSASLLAYQDWECMEKQKEMTVSHKRGGGGLQSTVIQHAPDICGVLAELSPSANKPDNLI